MLHTEKRPDAQGRKRGKRDMISLATLPRVVRRAFITALVVGIVLALINHGQAILAGAVSVDAALRMALTFLVPYLVSTTSSVLAIIENTNKEN
jgi:Mg/Co/Ni transporter MgtE